MRQSGCTYDERTTIEPTPFGIDTFLENSR
jgi:hypothetical protein